LKIESGIENRKSKIKKLISVLAIKPIEFIGFLGL